MNLSKYGKCELVAVESHLEILPKEIIFIPRSLVDRQQLALMPLLLIIGRCTILGILFFLVILLNHIG